METILLFFSLKYRGNWDRIYLALEQKEPVLKTELTATEKLITSDYLTIIDPKFPTALKQCSNPPFVLYTYGNQGLLINYDQTIAIISGEKYAAYGAEVTHQLITDWIQKRCVLVVGSDMILNEVLFPLIIENGGHLILIIKEDLISFKMKNMDLIKKFKLENLLIISEFYQDLDPNFNNQNLYQRLLVALSRRLVFIQIAQNETNFDFFNQALREEKETFSVPEPVNSSFDGSNLILKRRGKLVETGDDVMPIPIYH